MGTLKGLDTDLKEDNFLKGVLKVSLFPWMTSSSVATFKCFNLGFRNETCYQVQRYDGSCITLHRLEECDCLGFGSLSEMQVEKMESTGVESGIIIGKRRRRKRSLVCMELDSCYGKNPRSMTRSTRLQNCP
ncbi:unnamed protein product [Lepeophtheirus salmonis]|uniref:(salmon louse) hypothetical protein n=1 Tax=Lepeophtheirus salmonis TaxID=72036 RepID=A0A7R8HDY4_LEPSM|nr:unnamed protein product [Lepeophtheirus salmonis]CAF3038181.1 unnamed protein product [Lepeophtheirus salmonis]